MRLVFSSGLKMTKFLLISCALLLATGAGARPNLGCSTPEAIQQAEGALDWINQDQTQGYVLALNRVYDLEKNGPIYRMSLDVVETRCHASSRKTWKQCQVRDISSLPVHGECEVSAYQDGQVQGYSCVLREVPATDVVRVCPDCPTADDLSDPIIQDTASLCLQSFNEESTASKYFRVDNITKAYSQWTSGPHYSVEFTIVETVCSKSSEYVDVNTCAPMDCQFAHRGFCVGSHTNSEVEFEKVQVKKKKTHSVSVNCEIFEPEEAAVEDMTESNPVQLHNHTHLHPHRHPAPPPPQVPKGTVVYGLASRRAPPAASACPGTRRHQLV